MQTLYTAQATTTGGGRNGGHGETSDGHVKADFAMPKELGGPGGEGTNPEQLVALGYSACFGSAIAFVAGRDKVELDVSQVSVTCKVHMGRGGPSFAFEFEIEAHVPLPQAEADKLVAAAHEVCPYSTAFKNGAPTTARAVGAG